MAIFIWLAGMRTESCLACTALRKRASISAMGSVTTAMLLTELLRVAPVIVQSLLPRLEAELQERLTGERSAAAARAIGRDGKVVGLPTEWVDELWATGMIDQLVVEADGSRGASLKAFAAHEPQAPSTTTLMVQVVGMDVLGMRLSEPHVHRAELLLSLIHI